MFTGYNLRFNRGIMRTHATARQALIAAFTVRKPAKAGPIK